MGIRFLWVILFFIIGQNVLSQGSYAPDVDTPGTTAIYKDSSVFIGWATACTINRGWQNIQDTTLGKTTFGSAQSAIGQAGTNGVVSLGDGGEAILTFEHPIVNGIGADFAVFENAFDNNFLELAFVEVSSNGVDFVRFPAHSETQDSLQIGGFGSLEASYIHNLAGKYRVNYGTPFDLEDLIDSAGVDIDNITHVKIIDVVGSVDSVFARYDAYGNKINDPFPTPFPSSGFDLDAVGVIHNFVSVAEEKQGEFIDVFPNPVSNRAVVSFVNKREFVIKVFDLRGQEIFTQMANGDRAEIDVSHLGNGTYLLQVFGKDNKLTVKKLVVCH